MACCAWWPLRCPALLPPRPSPTCSPNFRNARHSSNAKYLRNARLSSNAKYANRGRIQLVARMVSVEAKAKGEPMKVMIAGPPASGKGTQCELIVNKYGLVHISIGDLLRAEVASGTKNGKRAKVYMEKGILVPDEIIVMMVKERLAQQDVQEKGWLLDGFPQSSSQAEALEDLGIRPDLFIVLEVKAHLRTHKQNAEDLLFVYKDVMKKVDANRPKEQVFQQVDSVLERVHEELKKPRDIVLPHIPAESRSLNDGRLTKRNNWKGIPTKLNNVPHSREIRQYFYEDVLAATARALEDGVNRVKVEINIPELNPDMDVYRIGTLMELVRVLALSFADDGKRIKVCVQGSMGEGMLSGMPLQLAGTRRILEFMDWGDTDVIGTFINIGSIDAKEVTDDDDMFILVAPQNAVGNCIIDDLQAMVEVANPRPMILVNPRLKDMPSASGVMQTIGRDKRLEFVASFSNSYYFRLLYKTGTQYPIMGALRMSYPYPYELYKRIDTELGKEKYVELTTFAKKPSSEEINHAFDGQMRAKQSTPAGIWGLLSSIF